MLNKVYYENDQGVIVTYIVEFNQSEIKSLKSELERLEVKICALEEKNFCPIDIQRLKRRDKVKFLIKKLESDSIPPIIA